MPSNAINVGGKMYVPIADLVKAEDRIHELEQIKPAITKQSMRSAIEHCIGLILITQELGRDELVTRDELMLHLRSDKSPQRTAILNLADSVDLIYAAAERAVHIIMNRNT